MEKIREIKEIIITEEIKEELLKIAKRTNVPYEIAYDLFRGCKWDGLSDEDALKKTEFGINLCFTE